MASGYQFSAPRLLLRTITRTFDFRGRSTRTEVLLWFLIVPLFAVAAYWATLPFFTLNYETMRQVQHGLFVLFYIPFVALFARRLNDQGASRWWLLVLPLGLVDEALKLLPDPPEVPGWILGAANLVAVAAIFGWLFLQGSSPGPN
jgi:uncharacterized membrane protein YhaH (DUF805 family)